MIGSPFLTYGLAALLLHGIQFSEEAPSEAQRALLSKGAAWRLCLRDTFEKRSAETADKSAAIEAAFDFCKPEEDDLYAMGVGFAGFERTAKALAAARADAKANLQGKPTFSLDAMPLYGDDYDVALWAKGAIWNRCIDRSFAEQFAKTSDKAAAIEAIFESCKTEEDDLYEVAVKVAGPERAATGRMAVRARTKRQLEEKGR